MSILFKNLFIYLLIFFNNLLSVSAPPFPFEVEQPDGRKITVRMYGSEYYNWMETEDGYVINFVEDDTRRGWYYSKLDSEGHFAPSNIQVEDPAPLDLNIPKHLRELFPKARYFQSIPHMQKHKHNASFQRRSAIGQIRPLVFLVDFEELNDQTYSKDQFEQLLFAHDLNSYDAGFPSHYDMSVRDYYDEISNGKLEIYGNDKSIIDWTKAKQAYSYYADGVQGAGQGNGPNGSDNHAQSAAALVVEIAMENYSEINFANFDGDDDGVVDVIILIVEGWMGNGDNNKFWPQMSSIPATSENCTGICEINPEAPTDDAGYFSFENFAIKKYIIIPEQTFTGWGDFYRKGDIQPIGTICHELGHVLGLPDLYDNSPEKLTAGIGAWGLMGSGNYQVETSPAYMSAWSRYRLGFIEPLVLENISNMEVILPPAEGLDVGAAYILPMNPRLPQEYLILENRQKIGADRYLKQSGLLVWHIDEIITDMYPAMNFVNVNPEFYGVNLLQADGLDELYTCMQRCEDDGDPFPGSSGNTSITGLTFPNTDLYSYDRDVDGDIEIGGKSNISLYNIFENSDSIVFSITNPNYKGQILSYDELGPNYVVSFSKQIWVGILITSPDTVMLSGVQTFLPPSHSTSNNINDYNLNIYSGWSDNQPVDLIYSGNQRIELNQRDVGWIFISLLEEMILLNRGEKYYIEFLYNGTNVLYSYDGEGLSGSLSKSYIRVNEPSSLCYLLGQATDIEGDWNIRVVLSGLNDFDSLSNEIDFIPQEHRIDFNYPNPFNPSTIFPIYLSRPADVELDIFDLRGRKVDYTDFSMLSFGYHKFKINFSHLSSGIYFYQFTISGAIQSPMKMALLK